MELSSGDRDEVYALGLQAELEARTHAGVEILRAPADTVGWRVVWHGEPDEAAMRLHTAEAMDRLAPNTPIRITSYNQQPINFDQLAKDAIALRDPQGTLSRADRRELTRDANTRLRALAKQGGWTAVQGFLRTIQHG